MLSIKVIEVAKAGDRCVVVVKRLTGTLRSGVSVQCDRIAQTFTISGLSFQTPEQVASDLRAVIIGDEAATSLMPGDELKEVNNLPS